MDNKVSSITKSCKVPPLHNPGQADGPVTLLHTDQYVSPVQFLAISHLESNLNISPPRNLSVFTQVLWQYIKVMFFVCIHRNIHRILPADFQCPAAPSHTQNSRKETQNTKPYLYIKSDLLVLSIGEQ